ncbi:hypothetical protein B0H13DRAFT_2001919 [Mycena leptocephala]|nr:hypothetical protein B0H13DRAFT_2001919 [Mycena leptocephala]
MHGLCRPPTKAHELELKLSLMHVSEPRTSAVSTITRRTHRTSMPLPPSPSITLCIRLGDLYGPLPSTLFLSRPTLSSDSCSTPGSLHAFSPARPPAIPSARQPRHRIVACPSTIAPPSHPSSHPRELLRISSLLWCATDHTTRRGHSTAGTHPSRYPSCDSPPALADTSSTPHSAPAARSATAVSDAATTNAPRTIDSIHAPARRNKL